MLFILVILVAALFFVRFYYFSPKQKGKRGEHNVQKLLAQLPESDYTIFNDLIFKTSYGTTQIDHVVASKYGVFVIETKNYRGEIYGNDDQQEWKQIIKTNVTYHKKWWKTYTHIKKSEFYNPVRQSIGHVVQIRKILSCIPNVNAVSIVVFSDNADLSGVNSSHHVVNSCQLLQCICSYTLPCLSDQELARVCKQLYDMNVREVVSDREHERNVRQSHAYSESMIQNGFCPRCGKQLVYRHGKYGDFYGCSGYPSCRFTKQC